MVRLSRLLNTQKVVSWSLDSIKASFLTKWKFFYLIKINIKHFISSQSNLWQEITAQRTNLKVCGVVVITSALQAESLQFKPGQHQGKLIDKMMFFYLIKIKIKHFISSQSNIWQEITAQSTNLKVCGVVVITSAVHTEGRQFKPGQH